jgi:DNA-binding transcriptional regulator LsrR (DeoR family)
MPDIDPADEVALICTVAQRFLEAVRTSGNSTASVRKMVRALIKEDPAKYGKLTPQRAYRCLQLAFAHGFLQFFPPTNHKLQTWLETRFPHLDSVTVVDSLEVAHLAVTAARKIQRLLTNLARTRGAGKALTIGLGGGHTVHEVLSHLDLAARDDNDEFLLPPVLLVGLTAGFDPADCSTVPNYLLGMLANKFPGRVEQCGLFAPGLLEKAAMKDVKSRPGTREAVALKDKLDLIVAGLGSAGDEGSVFWKWVREQVGGKPAADPKKRPVGDILFAPFNVDGEPVELSTGVGMMAIVDPAELRQFVRSGKTRVVTVVGRRSTARPTKAEALLAALKGELFDTLITDTATARDVQARFERP